MSSNAQKLVPTEELLVSALFQLAEAQHAVVVLADMHLSRGAELPEMPVEIAHTVTKARDGHRKHVEMEARGLKTLNDVLARLAK